MFVQFWKLGNIILLFFKITVVIYLYFLRKLIKCLSFSISISYKIIVYCQLDQGANFVLQKVQYDAAGKLSVRSFSTVYFPIIKSHHPVLNEKMR